MGSGVKSFVVVDGPEASELPVDEDVAGSASKLVGVTGRAYARKRKRVA